MSYELNCAAGPRGALTRLGSFSSGVSGGSEPWTDRPKDAGSGGLGRGWMVADENLAFGTI